MDEPGPSISFLHSNEPEVTPAPLPPQGHSAFDYDHMVDPEIYSAWKRHLFTFASWMVLSIAGVILIPFSRTLDADEAMLVSLGPWMGLIASGIYFLPIPLRKHTKRIKYLAFVMTIFSILAFVLDFPTAVVCGWSMKEEREKIDAEDDDIVLGISAGVLLLGGCFSVVAFAKCMMMSTYETSIELFKSKDCS